MRKIELKKSLIPLKLLSDNKRNFYEKINIIIYYIFMTISTLHIPNNPWVYIFKNKKNEILYIWKAKNLKKRVDQYFSPWSVWKQDMVNKASSIDFIVVNNESEALYLEDNLIKKHLPEYNRLLKADNSYVYIKITNEEFPLVILSRDRKNDKSTYIWPKHNTMILKKLMQYLRQIYKFRTSNNWIFNKWELSSDYYFWLDAWRSMIAKLNSDKKEQVIANAAKVWLILDKSYEEYKSEYKKIINNIKLFFEWNTKSIINEIKNKINESIKEEKFEYAAILRDIFFHISQMTEQQNVVLDPHLSWKIIWVTTIETHHIIVIIHVFEWKMIDIVREKYLINDRSYNQIITACENDFWTMNIYEWYNNNVKVISDREEINSKKINQILLISSTMKKIKKTSREAILILMNKFVDSYISSESFNEDSLLNELLSNLEKKYNLKSFPYIIECIDISHLSWWRISGGLSHFQGWISFKNGYRRYKIQSLKQEAWYSNDYQALKEIIIRRFILSTWTKTKEDEKNFPSLFVLDWWKWQLWILIELINKYPEIKKIMTHTEFVSLWKGSARKRDWKSSWSVEIIYKLDENYNIIEYNLDYDQTDQILLKIRDEAHRFANKYRKKRMSMERKK